ncbi:hypothetical protein Ciccas_013659, partial [Cichlidogyrus casuarinus]
IDSRRRDLAILIIYEETEVCLLRVSILNYFRRHFIVSLPYLNHTDNLEDTGAATTSTTRPVAEGESEEDSSTSSDEDETCSLSSTSSSSSSEESLASSN